MLSEACSTAAQLRSDSPCAPPDLEALPGSTLITRKQLIAVSGFALPTLKMWARQGRGPRVTFVEGRPRYRVADVRAWIGEPSK